ncbi:MAG: hypothetical protein GY778_30395 [bacterium]|nr:hypothetical protein [bacterium]
MSQRPPKTVRRKPGSPAARVGPGRSLSAAALLFLAGCAARIALPLPGDADIRSPDDVDAERVRARLDRDGDGFFDGDLRIGPFPFGHGQDIVPFLEATGVEALHARLSFEMGTDVVIPANHPVDVFLNVLLSDQASGAHGLLVVVDAADAAGLPPVGDVLGRAGPDQTADVGQTVTLNGAASLSFVDGRAVTLLWSQLEGATVDLTGADTSEASFVAPDTAAGSGLVFQLMVSDGSATDADVVRIAVAAAEPDDGDGDAVGDAAAGEAAYADNGCGACHGDDAQSGFAPALTGEQTSALEERFADGAAHNGKTLTEQQIRDVAAWLATLEP